jgi:hypothetical protein
MREMGELAQKSVSQLIVNEDGGSRIEELRVRGNTTRITVTPKVGPTRGYEIITLCDEQNRHHTRPIHRLVLETFVRPKQSGEECRHLDGNTRNNHLDNLHWGTAAENMADKIAHGTWVRGSRVGNSRLTEEQVRQIKRRLARKEPHSSIAVDYGVKPVTISAISAGRNWAWI